MRSRHVLIAMLVLMLVSGMVEPIDADAPAAPAWWIVLSTFLSGFLPFYWYRLDSEARLFLPSRWMSTGMVALTPFVLPIYLLRTRPRGQRLRALLRYFGFLPLLLLAAMAGAVLRLLLA